MLPSPPFWDQYFDYYLIDPPADQYRMASAPLPGETPRVIGGAATVTRNHQTALGQIEPESEIRDVEKQPGQGEFDSIHIAPKMRVSNFVINRNKNLSGLDAISMAPFCVHDCFHMHWRWATWHRPKWNRGWDGRFRSRNAVHHWCPAIRMCRSIWETITSHLRIRRPPRMYLPESGRSFCIMVPRMRCRFIEEESSESIFWCLDGVYRAIPARGQHSTGTSATSGMERVNSSNG